MDLFSLEAEAAVLGSLILEPDKLDKALSILAPQDFFFPENQIVFETLVIISEQRCPEYCLIIVRDELKKAKKLEAVGGVPYLVQLAESVPSTSNLEHYADIVKEKSKLRAVLQKVENMKADMQDCDSEGIVGLVQELAGSMQIEEKEVSVLREQFGENYDKMYDEKSYLHCGLKSIDGIIPGFEPGQLVIIAARPSIGKTALAMTIAVNMARAGNGVLFFSFEMTKAQLTERILCGEAGVPLWRAKKES